MKTSLRLAAVLALLLPSPALAYIGPGAGLGVIAVAVAFVVGMLLLIAGLVWYPLKRMLKSRRRTSSNNVGPDETE